MHISCIHNFVIGVIATLGWAYLVLVSLSCTDLFGSFMEGGTP